VRIGDEEIDIDRLPRAAVGGLKPGPVEELLTRVAHEYELLLGEVLGLRQARDEGTQPAPALRREPEPQREPDELVRVALASAQRTAREMRESARRDCDLMLRKVSARKRKLERELARARAEARREMEALEGFRVEVRGRMRAQLQEILAETSKGVLVEETPEAAASERSSGGGSARAAEAGRN